MKLLNFFKNDEIRIGVKTEKGILDIQETAKFLSENVPSNTTELIKENALPIVENLIKRAEEASTEILYYSEEEMVFAPSVVNPEKIICVGLNYISHVEETKSLKIPKEPLLFSKFNNALAAHNENVPVPKRGEKLDYEAELVIVMDKKAQNVSKEDALSFVFGYTAGNDLSVRDLQFLSGQWLIGKTLDKFAPIGPYLVTGDELNPTNLNIECKLNGVTVQSSNTKYMIFDIPTIVSYISQHITLQPGDIILSGTPEGVIMGLPEGQQSWLKSGDEVEIVIEDIGTLKNKLV